VASAFKAKADHINWFQTLRPRKSVLQCR